MIRLFTTQSNSNVYVDDVAKLAVSVIDASPVEYAKLVAIPYSELAFNDWTEAEFVDQFALTPLRNLCTVSTDTIEVLAAKYIISKIPSV